MTVHIALLRGINVGGRRKVGMADLRAFTEGLGFEDVRTVLQSGNLVFRGGGAGGPKLESRLEQEAAKALGLQTEFLVRSAAQWAELVAANPFPGEAEDDPSHLLVMPLKGSPKKVDLAPLRAAIKGRERVEASAGALFLVYPDGIGRSKLTLDLIERKVGHTGTGRNWNTALKLHALASELGG